MTNGDSAAPRRPAEQGEKARGVGSRLDLSSCDTARFLRKGLRKCDALGYPRTESAGDPRDPIGDDDIVFFNWPLWKVTQPLAPWPIKTT